MLATYKRALLASAALLGVLLGIPGTISAICFTQAGWTAWHDQRELGKEAHGRTGPDRTSGSGACFKIPSTTCVFWFTSSSSCRPFWPPRQSSRPDDQPLFLPIRVFASQTRCAEFARFTRICRGEFPSHAVRGRLFLPSVWSFTRFVS